MTHKMILALFSILFCIGPTFASTIEQQIEQNISQSLETFYSPRTRFLMAVTDLQKNAYRNHLDEHKIVQGTLEAAVAYQQAVENHSDLYALELYTYLHNRLAKPGLPVLIDKYLIRSLRKTCGRMEVSKGRKCYQAERILQEKRVLFRKYAKLALEVRETRKQIPTLEIEQQVASVEIPPMHLNHSQIEQVGNAVKYFVPLGRFLSKADPDTLKFMLQGITQDPFLAQNEVVIDFPHFLFWYGRYSYQQKDGVILSEVGDKLLKLLPEQDALNKAE